jgi:hypothetical protein
MPERLHARAKDIAQEVLAAASLFYRQFRETLAMAWAQFRGNPQIVTALRGALRSGRVPHALLFTVRTASANTLWPAIRSGR